MVRLIHCVCGFVFVISYLDFIPHLLTSHSSLLRKDLRERASKKNCFFLVLLLRKTMQWILLSVNAPTVSISQKDRATQGDFCSSGIFIHCSDALWLEMKSGPIVVAFVSIPTDRQGLCLTVRVRSSFLQAWFKSHVPLSILRCKGETKTKAVLCSGLWKSLPMFYWYHSWVRCAGVFLRQPTGLRRKKV